MIRTRVLALAILGSLALSEGSVRADEVLIRDGFVTPDRVNALYNQPGNSSSIDSIVTAADLSGVDLLIISTPTTALFGSEVSAIAAYLALGNKVVFLGEGGVSSAFATSNAHINSAITLLGGTMQINPGEHLDQATGPFAPQVATRAGGQILPHALTDGVDLIHYSGVSSISGFTTGNDVLRTQDLTNVWAATESAGGGSILLIADTQMGFPFLDPQFVNDNDEFFLNLLTEPFVSNTPQAIPEPGTLALVTAGALGAAVRRRRRKRVR